MATTGRQVFDLAMALIDEIPDSGVISEASVKSYLVKTPALLSIIETELAFKERIELPPMITDLSLPLSVSDRACRLVMPYGLAAHLMLEENADTASFFNQKFEDYKKRLPVAFVKTTDVYSGEVEE